jgi:hypothetical protein
MEKQYELEFYESIHPYANPYWLWIKIYFYDEGFYFYLKDVCKTKHVAIYESTDPFLQKLLLPSSFIHLDKLDNLLKRYRIYHQNELIEVDLTEDLQFCFDTEKRRERFKKQFTKEVQKFIDKEYKNYLNILSKMK